MRTRVGVILFSVCDYSGSARGHCVMRSECVAPPHHCRTPSAHCRTPPNGSCPSVVVMGATAQTSDWLLWTGARRDCPLHFASTEPGYEFFDPIEIETERHWPADRFTSVAAQRRRNTVGRDLSSHGVRTEPSDGAVFSHGAWLRRCLDGRTLCQQRVATRWSFGCQVADCGCLGAQSRIDPSCSIDGTRCLKSRAALAHQDPLRDDRVHVADDSPQLS